MRPRSALLPAATCRNSRLCAASSFARTTPGRPTLPLPRIGANSQQQRCITQQYIRRMKDAEKEWAGFAEEIKAGKRKSFTAHLEERGLIHDVVGYGFNHLSFFFFGLSVSSYNIILTALSSVGNANCWIKSSRRRELGCTLESTRLRPPCTLDICFLLWCWLGDTSGAYR